MPTYLKFLLTNPALRLHIEEGVETSSLWFDATIERPHDLDARFKIYCPGKEYDAYNLKCEANLRQVVSKIEPEQSPLPDPNTTFGIEEKPDCITIAYPPSDCEAADKFEPFFTIYLALPTSTFQRVLQVNPETRLVHLLIDTAMDPEGLVYGNNYDHNEIEWRVEKKNYAHVTSITLMIKPRPEIALESEPSPEVKPQVHPVPTPVITNSSDHAKSAINDLFWTFLRRMLR